MSIDIITLTASKNYTDKQIEKASIKGADGFSPVASVTQTNSGAVITITDKGGTTTATVTNGKDGATGEKGEQGIQGETGAKGDKGDTGANGKDGTSATHSWNGTVLTITSASGTSSANLKGDKGDTGKDGTSVTVKSVSESTADGGSNVVTFSDGKTLTVKNGSKGSTGAAGPAPVRGVDYWTPVDQESIVQDVLRALGTPVFGRIDINNNITLTGELAEGVYTLWYEDKNGKTTKLCTYNTAPEYTNWLKRSTEADGTPYNGGQGWKTDTRLNSSGVETTSDAASIEVTGFIPVKYGDVIRFKNITIPARGPNDYTYSTQTYFTIYDADKNVLVSKNLGYLYLGSTNTQGYGLTLDGPKGNIIEMRTNELYNPGYPEIDWRNESMAFFRISCEEINDNSIITINQEISEEETDNSGLITIEWAAGVKLDKNTGAEGEGSNYGASQSILYDSDYQYTIATTNSYLVQTAICWYASDGSYLGWNEATGAGTDSENKTAVLVPLDNSASFRIRAYTIYSSDDSLRAKALNTVSLRKDMVGGVSYTNWIPLSINADGTQYVGTNGEDGYKTGTRLNSSGVEVIATNRNDIWTTGFMPIKKGDTVYVANLNWIVGGPSSTYSSCYISTYREDFSHITGGTAFETMVSNVTTTYEVDPETNQLISLTLDNSINTNINDVAWFRMSFARISNAVPIITVNQPIV